MSGEEFALAAYYCCGWIIHKKRNAISVPRKGTPAFVCVSIKDLDVKLGKMCVSFLMISVMVDEDL